jgi:hypothetical protein
VNTLHGIRNSIDKPPDDLALLLSDLILLSNLMQKVSENISDDDDFVLQACYTRCELVVKGVNELEAKINIEATSSRKERLLKVLELRNWKEDVIILRGNISAAKENFIL